MCRFNTSSMSLQLNDVHKATNATTKTSTTTAKSPTMCRRPDCTSNASRAQGARRLGNRPCCNRRCCWAASRRGLAAAAASHARARVEPRVRRRQACPPCGQWCAINSETETAQSAPTQVTRKRCTGASPTTNATTRRYPHFRTYFRTLSTLPARTPLQAPTCCRIQQWQSSAAMRGGRTTLSCGVDASAGRRPARRRQNETRPMRVSKPSSLRETGTRCPPCAGGRTPRG